TLTIDRKTYFFDPLGLFCTTLEIEPLENIREAMQEISGPIFSTEEFKTKLEKAQQQIPDPEVQYKIEGFVPVSIAKDVLRELIEEGEIPGIKLQSRMSEEEFSEKVKGATKVVDQLKWEVSEIKGYISSLIGIKDSLEKELKEKEEQIRRTYETRVEDARRYLGSKAEPEVEKLKAEMESEIRKLKEALEEPLKVLSSLLERLEAAVYRRESFVKTLEKSAPEGLDLEIPFIIASLSGKEGRRFIVIPPSNVSKVGIGGKIKKAFGAMVVPIDARSPLYERMGSLLEEELHSNIGFSAQMSEMGKETNLIVKYSGLIMRGITRLRDMEILDEDDATEVMSMVL
ncbi:MAG: hypothetical protein DRN90_06440, partial [Thermoproteota archaeon]